MPKYISILFVLTLITCSEKSIEIKLKNEIDLLAKYSTAEITAPTTTYVNQDFKDIELNKDYRWSIFSHPNSQIKYATGIDLDTDFELEFYIGIDEKAWNNDSIDKTDGVQFLIYDQNNNILFDQHLDPLRNVNDRGWIKQNINIKATDELPITEIIFETKTGTTSTSDWAYWAEPKINIIPVTEINRENDHINIVLITLDTVRKDYLGIYGNNWINTPQIDTIAKNGILFENAYSSSSTTSPSHVSIFTSLNPNVHGVIGNDYHLANKVPTLTKILSENGYHTGAAVSVHHLNPQICGLGEFFDTYNHPKKTNDSSRWKLINSGYSTVSSGIEFLDENHNNPFFLWLHMYDAHMPYIPVAEYDRRYYKDNPYNNSFTSMKNAFYDQHFDINNEPWMIGIRDLNYFKRQYGAEITYLDDQIKRVLDSLKRLNIEDNTLIIITADHGECLGEHEMYFNHWGLFEEETNVPLIFYYPKVLPKNKRIDEHVSIIDIAPTILDIVGLKHTKTSQEVFDGLSLTSIWEDNKTLNRNHIMTNSLYYIQTAYIGKRYKVNWVIRDATYNVEHYSINKDRVLVYDLINDPKENKPVAGFIWDSEGYMNVKFSKEDTFHEKVFKIKENAKLKTVPTVKQLRSQFLLGNPGHFIDQALKDNDELFQEVHNGLTEMIKELNVDLKDKIQNVVDISELDEIQIQSMSITDQTFLDQMKSLGYSNN